MIDSDLSQEEQKLLDECNALNPNKPKVPKISESIAYQQNILSVLHIEDVLNKVIDYLKPEYFHLNKNHEVIARILLCNYRLYGKIPSQDLINAEIDEKFKDLKAIELKAEYDVIRQNAKIVTEDKPQYEKRLKKFCIEQQQRTSVSVALDLLDKNQMPDDFFVTEYKKIEQINQISQERFKSYSFEELCQLPDPEYIVQHHLAENSCMIVFGQSGSFKSFYVVEMGLSIATGLPFMNNFAINKPQPVLYLCSEGFSGCKKRVLSWWISKDKPNLDNFHVVDDRFKSITDMPALLDFAQSKFGRPAILIIDTLSCNFLGKNTDSNDDMNFWFSKILPLTQKTSLIINHHAGWETTHERGASAIRDNSHTTIKLQDTGAGISVKNLKQKDFEPFRDYGFFTRKVEQSLVLEFVESVCVTEKDIPVIVDAIKKEKRKLIIKEIEKLPKVKELNLSIRQLKERLSQAEHDKLLEIEHINGFSKFYF